MRYRSKGASLAATTHGRSASARQNARERYCPPTDVLEVEPDHGQHLADRLGPEQELLLGTPRPPLRAEEHRVIPEPGGDLGLADRLPDVADGARDPQERPVADGLADGLGGEREHRLVQACGSDRELGRVHADRDAARAGGDVVPREGTLSAFVQAAFGGEGQRVGRDDAALAEQPGLASGKPGCRWRHQKRPSRRSNFVGLLHSVPPRRIQSAWALTSACTESSG